MNLEKLAREIAMCKSPNVDKWLVPIVDLEGMIALIQRQESELAASRDENEALKAAQKPLADSFVSPLVTVDTPEFAKRVADFCDAHQRGSANYMSKTWLDLVAHIDAHTARAVAAERADLTAQWDAHQEAVRDLQAAAQPVAGELPPLPELPTHAVLYTQNGYRRAATTPRAGDALVLKQEALNAMRVYGSQCRAAQPVQQPAAVVGQEPVDRIEMMRAHASVVVTGICAHAKNGHAMTGWLDDACTSAEILQKELKAAPVPAAGVQGDDYAALYEKCEKAKADLREFVQFVRDVRDATEYSPKIELDDFPTPEQRRRVLAIIRAFPGMLRQSERETDNAFDAGKRTAAQPVDSVSLNLEAQLRAVIKQRDDAIRKRDESLATVQPDSGRDAALVELADPWVSAVRSADNLCPCELSTPDKWRWKAAHIQTALAAHPAPSSDAALDDAAITAFFNARDFYPENIQRQSAFFDSVRELIAQRAAHPANGTQAGHQAPFMYAIKGPDGSAYIDENCVSATEEGLYLEVNGLNDSPDAGYSIVPVFLAAAPQKKEG